MVGLVLSALRPLNQCNLVPIIVGLRSSVGYGFAISALCCNDEHLSYALSSVFPVLFVFLSFTSSMPFL